MSTPFTQTVLSCFAHPEDRLDLRSPPKPVKKRVYYPGIGSDWSDDPYAALQGRAQEVLEWHARHARCLPDALEKWPRRRT